MWRCRQVRAVGDIQVGLVQRQGLDQVGVVAKDRLDFLRRLLIGIHARLDDGQVRAELQGMPRRHGGTHPIRPRFVVACSDHAPSICRPTYRQGLLRQARVIAHLNGGVEAITVNVDDFALRHK